MRTNVGTRSVGASDSFISGVFATIGGTTRATQLSIGTVLRENGFGNAIWSSAVTTVLPAGSCAKTEIGVFTSWSYDRAKKATCSAGSLRMPIAVAGKPGYVRSPTRTPDWTSAGVAL